MQGPVHWGMLGTGSIARKFATGLTALPDAKLAAVGSRAQETADAFGDEFDVPRRHPSYEALANDPQVDVVYVATPHSLHRENTLLCLAAGKGVLCEKPFAINARQAAEMIAAARARGLFLMEAMWTRCLPAIGKLRDLLAEGAIGDVRMVVADFGFRAGVAPGKRLFNPALGGGALLDVGVYPVSLASMVFGGPPDRIASLAALGETGVDEQAGMVLGYDGGRLAVLHTAIRTRTAHEAQVYGTDGRVRVPDFWHATHLFVVKGGGEERIDAPFDGNGYNHEAAEVMDCLRAGRRESDVMPLDESLAVMETLDRIREQWGLRYPME
ncbi:MAG: Gfo/Idh/MocA family oxidoreductase [Planctomycetota bacterium]